MDFEIRTRDTRHLFGMRGMGAQCPQTTSEDAACQFHGQILIEPNPFRKSIWAKMSCAAAHRTSSSVSGRDMTSIVILCFSFIIGGHRAFQFT